MAKTSMIRKYGLKACVHAYYEHRYGGYGAAGYALDHGYHYNTADALMNAGRAHVEMIRSDQQLDYCKRILGK